MLVENWSSFQFCTFRITKRSVDVALLVLIVSQIHGWNGKPYSSFLAKPIFCNVTDKVNRMIVLTKLVFFSCWIFLKCSLDILKTTQKPSKNSQKSTDILITQSYLHKLFTTRPRFRSSISIMSFYFVNLICCFREVAPKFRKNSNHLNN